MPTISRLVILIAAASAAIAGEAPILRVCSDPNNLPYSNDAQEGFENRIASLVANDLGAQVHYVWYSQRTAFSKDELPTSMCDVSMGIPSTRDSALLTRPYYRSSYVFVSRGDKHLNLVDLGDPRFSGWRVGVNQSSEGYTPPGTLLDRHGLSANLTGFSATGGFEDPGPAFRVMEAVAKGLIDVAIVWEPLAAFYAQQTPEIPLEIRPVSPREFNGIPLAYGVSIAIMNRNLELRDQIDAAIAHQCDAIQAVLADYGISADNGSCTAAPLATPPER